MTKESIIESLKQVLHPGKSNKNIVDLGLLEDVILKDERLVVILAFPQNRDPLAEYIKGSVRATLFRSFPDIKDVEVSVKKKEKTKTVVEDLGLDEINDISHIIGIASGKGGVGKSTVAVNLAIALARLGYKVGLTDADVYGPSVPIMTQTEGALPEVINENAKEVILPIEKYGVKWMSIGYFAKPGQALIWRGPMACSALKQMVLQIRWGHLDFLLVDMPPGTGDIHISLVQDIPLEGAVIVSTPQAVALADVEKGVDMFRNKDINRKIFGLVENMAWFSPAELPDNKYYIFGKDGGKEMADKMSIPLLAQIPLVQSIREAGDKGEPAALSDGADGKAFMDLAKTLVDITKR